MQAEIRPIDIRLPAQQKQLNQLLNDTFGFGLQADDVWLNTQTDSQLGLPLYLGAFAREKLVGFNAWIAHDCHWKGQKHVFYQSCWSAVSPQHRGKGLFYQLQTASRPPLKAQGALGILGLPNEQSGPILTGPLEYENRGAFLRKSLFFPTLWTGVSRHFQTHPMALTPDTSQLLRLKQQQRDRDIGCYEDDAGNQLWGKFSQVKKGGISLTHFLVGGILLQEKADFRKLVRASARHFHARIMTFLYHESADFGQLFGREKVSKSGYLCWYPLNVAPGEITRFNCWTGLSDVF